MSDDLDQLDGKGLRSRLEAVLAENRTLRNDVVSLRASELLRKPEFGLVKPEDLVNVDLEKLEEQATALQSERTGFIRTLLEKQGLEGDALETKVSELIAGKTTEVATPAGTSPEADTVRQLGQITGAPVSTIVPSDLEGVSAMEFALSGKK